jgi:hypothetical protein
LALDELQNRHPMLATCIAVNNGRRIFDFRDEVGRIPLQALERTSETQWIPIAEHELGRRFDTSKGPLIRCTYLHGDPHSEIIVNFFHAIMDAASATAVVHDLFSLCGGEALPENEDADELPPPAEVSFPPAFKGSFHIARAGVLLLRLAVDEAWTRFLNRSIRKPPINVDGHCRILWIELDEKTTHKLARTARRKRLSLNSVLSAAMLLSVNRSLYNGRRMRMRAFTFPVLRAFLKPRVPDSTMNSCYVAVRSSFGLSNDHDVWALAEEVHDRVHRAAKRGDKFAYHSLSALLIRLILKQHNTRMGHTALSFMESLNVPSEFGRLSVVGMHAFVSNFGLGPELASQARVFQNRLCVDLMYLDSDMDQEKAEEIANSIRDLLIQH